MGSVIFVHGTGVRGESYKESFKLIQRKLDGHAPGWTAIECLWGDELGVKLHLQGKSVPNYPHRPAEDDELMRWWRLYQDPQCELRELAATEADKALAPPGQKTAWQALDEKIRAFAPSASLRDRLAGVDLESFRPRAAKQVLESEEYKDAVMRAGRYPGHFRRMVARAVFAMMTIEAAEKGIAAAPAKTRDEILALAVQELGGEDMGVRDLGKFVSGGLRSIANIFKANVGATALYSGALSRGKITDKSLPAAGDILLYQVRGGKIRGFIKSVIAKADPPIYLLAHSLGGIACVDLLAEERLPVSGLITAGSQAPLLYEMNALYSLEDGQRLRPDFPAWLNFYDPNDLLSYKGEDVFPNRVKDVEIASRQPFPQAHSAYWRHELLWEEISKFLR